MTSAPALWCTGPGQVELRPGALGEGVLVEMLYSGISRGTERLVFEGRVPESEYERMRGPAQEGGFPFPVKYGYCAVGRIAEGAKAGSEVLALHPHQERFRVPETSLTPLPDGLPASRAVLAPNMETALNALWDSGAGAGDRIAVVGAGAVGALIAWLAARLPGAEVTIVDLHPARQEMATALGCGFASPEQAPRGNCDVVFHCSASASGLATALECADTEATVVEASWYGEGHTPVPLGGAFHSRRLRLIGSQVGSLPPARRRRWDHRRRLTKALELLTDPTLDVLISGETDFEDLPDVYGEILTSPDTICHRIRYRDA